MKNDAGPFCSAWVLICAVLCALVVPNAGAQSRQPLKVAYSAIGGPQAPFWVAKEAGHFEKNGLQVQMIFIPSGTQVAQAMLSGDLDLAITGGPSVVQAALAGADQVMLTCTVNALAFRVVSSPQIQGPEALKGKKMGISRFGSLTDFAARYILEKWGLKPDRDVTLLQLGGTPETFAALSKGGIDSGILTDLQAYQARKLGFKELIDLGETGLEFCYNGVAASRSYVDKHSEIVRSFIKAHVEGIATFKRNRAFGVEVIKKYARLTDTDQAEYAYEVYAQKYVLRVPAPTVASIRPILENLGARDPKARQADPARFIEPRFVKELEESGFIKRLYSP